MTPPSPARSWFWKWWVCGALLLATFLNYMDRQALAVTLPTLKASYHVAEERIGWIEGSFGFAFAAGSILFGLAADRLGPRRLYPVVLVGWSAAGIATALTGRPEVTGWLEGPGDEPGAGEFRWLLLCRTVLGLFEAGHWPCALITAQRVLSAKDRPLGNGILQSGASLGAVLVPQYVLLVRHMGLGWQFAFWSVGAAGLLWVPLWVALVRRGDLDGPPPPAAGPVADRGRDGFVRQFVVLAVVVSCLNVSWQFLRAWLPLFLQDFHKFTPEATADCVSGYFISADVGCLLAGALARWLVARGWAVDAARKLGFAGFAGLTALAAVVPWAGSGAVMVAFLMLAGAGILGLHPYYYAFAQDLSARRTGIVSGGLAAVAWVASGLFNVAIGKRIQDTGSYDTGLVIVGLAPLLALAVLLLFGRRSGTAGGK